MKIFLSSTECGGQKKAIQADPPPCMLWNLMSYYYIGKDEAYAAMIRDRSRLVLINSGAHSFQKGKKVDWESYTHSYAAFINRFDRDNVLGYFEMDVDNIVGYDEVLRLRAILESESGHAEKIIPVWHKSRGVEDFKRMCRSHSGRVVAVTGFRNEDIRDEQYPMFLKYAWSQGCKVHCLGMTRKAVLDKVPFDFVDSSSWAQSALYGRIGTNKVRRDFSKSNMDDVFLLSYREAMKMQKRYYMKWRKVNHD